MPKNGQARQGTTRTFIEEARRRQIVEAAIDVITEQGYAGASLERIALKAGISRGLISYHFAGRDDLMAAVVTTVFTEAAAFMKPRMEAASSPTELLHEYLRGSLEYMRDHRAQLVSVVEISTGGSRGELRSGRSEIARGVGVLEQILRAGQRTGEFRPFDPHVMAVTMRTAVDNVPRQMALNPHLDLDAWAAELVDLFTRAVRGGGS
ncbi:MAG TPA: TetR/AcrR family transcriptional regulator [Candidatus Dormibacteraeota bacterium]|jgi:AcrR family transcriptional regulator|nr:TetR/AcrR family transcriptional regulator [Candidatus Dormibacteraeota bacterium]